MVQIFLMDQMLLLGTPKPLLIKQLGILYMFEVGKKKLVAQCNHVHSDAIARDTKSFAYQAIGLLAQRMPQLFKYSLSVPLHMECFFSLV